MPLSGTFIADFTSFQTAIDKAELSLRSFEAGSEKASSALNRMGNQFSGQKIIQEASLMSEVFQRAGGAAAFTEKELARMGAVAQEAAAKFKALGQDVPANIQAIADASLNAEHATTKWSAVAKDAQASTSGWTSALESASGVLTSLGIGLSISALAAFGEALFVDADALIRLRDKTGISVEGLQALRIAGDDAGVSLESMTSAVNMLQKRLGGDDQSALKALQDLGIEVKRFASLDGAGQMLALSDAVRGIDDPLRVANDLSALFGKTWAEQLPALKRGFKEVQDGVGQMSDEATKSLDKAGDAVGRFWRSFKAGVGEQVAIMLQATDGIDHFLTDPLDKATAAAIKAAPAIAAIVPPGLPADLADIGKALGNQDEALVKATDATNAAKAAAKSYAEAWENLNSMGADFSATADTIPPKLREQAEWYVKIGATVADVAAGFPELSKAQVAALFAMDAAQKQFAEHQTAILADSTKNWAEYNATLASLSLSTTEKQAADLKVWEANQIAAHVRAKTDTADFYKFLYEQEDLLRQKQDQNTELQDTNSRTSFLKRKTDAEDEYKFKVAHAEDYSAKDIEESRKRMKVAQDEWANWRELSTKALDDTIGQVHTLAGEWITAAEAAKRFASGNTITFDTSTTAGLDAITPWLKKGFSMAQAQNLAALSSVGGSQAEAYAAALGALKGPRVPGFERGVENFGGGMALVGERGPELLNLPSGSSITPLSGGGVTNINITNYINGTAEQAARKIGDIIMRDLKLHRQFGSA